MIHAYNELYLDHAMKALAEMLDFAVHDLQQDLSSFFDLFIASGVAHLFERGDAQTVAGIRVQ